MDSIKKVLKAFVKGIFKSKIIRLFIPLFLMFIVLLSASVYFITLDDAKYKEGDMSSTSYAASTYVKNIKFTEEGIVFLYKHTDETTGQEVEEEKTSSEMAQIIWNEMLKARSKVENYLDSVEDLEKLMNAEIITQYPKLDTVKTGYLNGTIEFERHKTNGDGTTPTKLKYIDLKKFNEKIEKNETDIVNYYTLDESENVLIGVVDQTTEKLTSNDEEIKLNEYTDSLGAPNTSRTEYKVYSKPINYKSVVSKYTMPFQYLWSLIVVGDDKGVGLDLADLVEDSQIVISIYDNITTTVNKSTYTYKREKKVNVTATATAVTNYGTYTKNGDWKPASQWTESEDYEVVHTFTYKNNTPIVDVTKADVWIVDFSKSYSQGPKETSNTTNEKSLKATEYEEESGNPKSSTDGSDLPYNDKFSDKLTDLVNTLQNEVNNSVSLTSVNNVVVPLSMSTSITSCNANYYKHNVKRNQKDDTKITKQKYVAGTVTNKPKVEKKTDKEIKDGTGQTNFVTILCEEKHMEARKKITREISSWLFEILEENADTANMVDLTKFLLYKVSGSDYGVTEYNFDEYSNNIFTGISTIYGNNFEEKVWFALIGAGYSEYSVAGAMGNFMQESGFKSNNLQNEYERKFGMSDETYTAGVNGGTYTNFVRDGAGYGLAQWTFWSRKEALLNYTNAKGVGIDDEDSQIEFLIQEIKSRGCSQWQSASSVHDACYYFEKEFEQAGIPQMGNRLAYAEDIYNRYHGQQAPSGEATNLTGDNATKMQAMLQEAQRIANDDRYTYSQANRYGEFQYDCSSFVARLYSKFFGIAVPGTTGSYGTEYRVGPASSVALQPGDVLWRSGHVTLYIGDGLYVAAHGSEGKYASNPAAQISVYNDSPSSYTYVYRFVNN